MIELEFKASSLHFPNVSFTLFQDVFTLHNYHELSYCVNKLKNYSICDLKIENDSLKCSSSKSNIQDCNRMVENKSYQKSGFRESWQNEGSGLQEL